MNKHYGKVAFKQRSNLLGVEFVSVSILNNIPLLEKQTKYCNLRINRKYHLAAVTF
jgi:hypothetical protein